jgi:hypothetical protein
MNIALILSGSVGGGSETFDVADGPGPDSRNNI